MSEYDDAIALGKAQHDLKGLGARPVGDPAALADLARQASKEADAAASAGRIEKGLPGSMVFEGPAGQRFAANAGQVAKTLIGAQHALDTAATLLAKAATKLAEDQRAYDTKRSGLESKVRTLTRKLQAESG